MIMSQRRLGRVQRGMAEGVDDVVPAKHIVDSRCCLVLSIGPVKCVCLLNGAAESHQEFLARH